MDVWLLEVLLYVSMYSTVPVQILGDTVFNHLSSVKGNNPTHDCITNSHTHTQP